MPLPRTARWSLLIAVAAAAIALGLSQLLPAPLTRSALSVFIGVAAGAFACAVIVLLIGDPADTATPGLLRRYYRQITAPTLLLFVMLLLWEFTLDHVHAPWLRAVVALLPILPMALLLRIVIRYILALDELQRRIETESIAFAGLLVGLGYFAMAFLQRADVIDVPAAQAMLWVLPAGCVLYIAARMRIQRRYK